MRVLLVDDNQSITGMLSEYLLLKGFEVTVTNDGRNGLRLIQTGKFDVILLDLSMPHFGGIDVINTLEKQDQLKDKKIFLFTASSISKEIINELLLKEGVYSYLNKPIRLQELVQAITT